MPHKSDPRKLFCTLTRHPLNKIPKQVQNHISSKKFKRLKKEYEDKIKKREERQRKKEEKQKAWEARKASDEVAGGEDESEYDSDASDFWVLENNVVHIAHIYLSFATM